METATMSYPMMPASAHQIPTLAGSGHTFGQQGGGYVTAEPGFVQDATGMGQSAVVGPYGNLGASDATVAMSESQFEALASGIPLLTSAIGEQIRARRESLRGLARQKARLKKKINRSSGAKRQQYREELQMVELQIADLKRMMEQAGDPPEAPGPNWLVLGAAAGLVGLLGLAVWSARRDD